MKHSLAALTLTLFLACGDGEEQLFRPDPLPLTAKDTAFVFVTGGVFISEAGDTVEISDFRLGRYEVSNRLYYYLADEKGLELPPDPEFPGMSHYLFEYPDYPVVNVSVREAAAAAAVLGGRLPTSSEWEYAASLGVSGDVAGQYPWGSLKPEDAEYPANLLAGDEWETRGMDGYFWTAPVDSFPLTDAGFTCQAGNVSEWTYSPLDSVLAVRGGAWLSPGGEVTIDAVKYLAPGDRARHIGFRILLPGT
ncbi:MAG: SUMF1/EgtB/PvdO family nonheme iron enzyme [Candidatus Aegiribacteria sp.]|nr:SUMF1/EgtB/PvdO family nonheme iron enzyme [Candidatus Aegiribacteria sp.]